jgi:hypothetical protein
MEEEHPLGGLGTYVSALVREHPRQPQCLAWTLGLVDVDLASARIHQYEPRQAAPDHEPDEEQPPVELGVHRRKYRDGSPDPRARPYTAGYVRRPP